MYLRLIAATLGAAVALAAPAAAANYRVTALGDALSGTCGPAGADGLKPCSTLRQAITEASADPDDVKLVLLGVAGTYTLNNGPLTPQDGVSLIGLGARSTTIAGDGESRALTVAAGSTVVLSNLAIENGGAIVGNELDGGNVLNEGSLTLVQVRVSDGFAAGNGGGIANRGGELTVAQSLLEDNGAGGNGGGVSNTSGGSLTVTDTTFAGNSASFSGGGIYTTGSAFINQATFSLNTPGAALSSSSSDVSVRGSIFYDNASSPNCTGTPPVSEGFNLDSGTSCGFGAAVDPQLGAQLVNRGGGTDVFELAPTSPALNYVSPCGSPLDQRGYWRSADPGNLLAPCDAGAYDHDAVAAVTQPPPPPPPPEPTPVPTPVPTPAPTPTATPRANQSVAATETKGTVLVKLPGTKRFVPLSAAVIGNGTEVDARKGTVELTTAGGEKARFSQGLFKVAQAGGVTTLTLSEKLSCPKARRSSAHAAAKKVKTRKLFGDGKGKFRTKGQYGAATVRGTKWLTTDTCTATTVKVTQGAVTFRDLVKRRNVVVRKGKSATARK